MADFQQEDDDIIVEGFVGGRRQKETPAIPTAALASPRKSRWQVWAALTTLVLISAVGYGVQSFLAKVKLRVFVAASEAFQHEPGTRSDGDKKDDGTQSAEFRLVNLYPCVVVTRDKQRADYFVTITIHRYLQRDLFGNWADAELSISKPNGDVALLESFFQNERSIADIGQMPVDRTGEFLCKKH
jgi:hypothetical protein